MRALREEIEEVIIRVGYPDGFKGYHDDSIKEVYDFSRELATALAALFEKRIEPLRKVYEKWTRTNGCNCETCVAVRSVVEGGER